MKKKLQFNGNFDELVSIKTYYVHEDMEQGNILTSMLAYMDLCDVIDI